MGNILGLFVFCVFNVDLWLGRCCLNNFRRHRLAKTKYLNRGKVSLEYITVAESWLAQQNSFIPLDCNDLENNYNHNR